MRFTLLIEWTKGNIVKETLSYDFRTGKIKGKYILNKIISQKEKAKIVKDYSNHLQYGLIAEGCSINEYLNIAGICYKAAFSKKAIDIKPLQMYKKWADERDGGILSIKNLESRKGFSNWYKNGLFQ